MGGLVGRLVSAARWAEIRALRVSLALASGPVPQPPTTIEGPLPGLGLAALIWVRAAALGPANALPA